MTSVIFALREHSSRCVSCVSCVCVSCVSVKRDKKIDERRASPFFLWHEWLVWVKSYGEKDMLRLFHFNIFGLVTRAWRPFFCATRHGDPLSLPTRSPHLIKPTIAIDIVSLGFIHPTNPHYSNITAITQCPKVHTPIACKSLILDTCQK